MANQLASLPWVIDTASATAITTKPVCFDAIVFQNYNAETDTCVVKDTNGRVVWRGNGHADLSPVEFHPATPYWIQGLIIDTIDSGEVVIYVA